MMILIGDLGFLFELLTKKKKYGKVLIEQDGETIVCRDT